MRIEFQKLDIGVSDLSEFCLVQRVLQMYSVDKAVGPAMSTRMKDK